LTQQLHAHGIKVFAFGQVLDHGVENLCVATGSKRGEGADSSAAHVWVWVAQTSEQRIDER